MKIKTITFIFLLYSSILFSQQNPLYLDNLPRETTFKFIGETDLHVSKDYKSEFYLAKISEGSTIFYIITQGLADCAIIANQFEGYDIYEKLKEEGFQRIVHIRKVGDKFKVHYVNGENENEKLVFTSSTVDDEEGANVMKIAYTFYWNNLLKK